MLHKVTKKNMAAILTGKTIKRLNNEGQQRVTDLTDTLK
jgi:hypothetical protein